MKRLLSLLACSTLLAFLAGCGGQARYVETTGTETIISVEEINIQDWIQAADDMTQNLLASGVLQRTEQQPPVLVVSRIVNNTSEVVDTNLLTKRIRVALNQSGQALTKTTATSQGFTEDQTAREMGELEAMRDPAAAAQARPDFSLSGRLIETTARAGKTRQATYTFQLSLTQISTGLALWEDQVDITKQGKKPAVGW
jgi:hypothetical protein